MWRALCIMQYTRKIITIQMPSHWVLAAMLWTHTLFQWPWFCHDKTQGDYYFKAISIANSDTATHSPSVCPPFCALPGLWWDLCAFGGGSRARLQSLLPGWAPRGLALQGLPAPAPCQPGLPEMWHPCSSWFHRPRDTAPQPTGALGFSHWPLQSTELLSQPH